MFHEWFQKHRMPLIAGLVNYEDLSFNSKHRLELFNKEDPRLFLIKSDSIAYQNEYRFVPFNLEVSEPMIVALGDLSVITEMHDSVELLNKEIILNVAKLV
jgi:hypothetical protein